VAAFTDVDLDDIVRSEVRSAATRFPRIELSSTITPVRVRGQADALRRVVSNLLENACEHGGSRVQVVVAEDDDGARVEVRDDGVGIPASEVNRIFERFARLDESRARATGGSGLGLAIASEIAADHDATIDVSHSEMGGADFVLHFRAQRPNIRPNV
jgi:signal transduction histidine kinase